MDKYELMKYIIENVKQPIWSNWTIKEKLGTGTFSEVYRIEAKRGKQIDSCALKVTPLVARETIYQPQDKQLYIDRAVSAAENESDIMYKLRNCPYIVRYEDELREELYIDGQFEGYYQLLRMELLSCVHKMLRKREFDLSENNIRKLAIDIGKGISVAHRAGVMHRDIKPDNLFLSQDGTYKLGDFNVSKQMVDTARTVTGANGYMAPEIYNARQNNYEGYTKQTDIYAYGITLYFLMNNLGFPFENDVVDQEQAIEKRMLGVRLPRPENASIAFGEIILKACEYNTKDRFQTIDEMTAAIEGLSDSPIPPIIPISPKMKRDENKTIYADSQTSEPHTPKEENGNLYRREAEMDGKGEGVEEKKEGAMSWLHKVRKSAEQREAAALRREFGIMYDDGYDNGYGVELKKEKAASWYHKICKAAKWGDATAQYTLGLMYDKGEGVKKSKEEAINWYRKSAEQGHVKAQYTLGYYAT